jgi:hypothetical protein
MNYENWKLEKFLRETEKQELNESLLMVIHQYFIFRNISSDENLKANIALSIIESIQLMPFLKLSIVKLAMEKIDISQNNISPAVVIDSIRKIYKSDLMAEIIKKHLDNSEIKQLPVGQKTYQEKYKNAQEYLATCKRWYDKKGIIPFMPHVLFDILTTEGYFKFVTQSLESLNEIAKQRIVKSLNTELINSNSGDWLVIKKRINEVKSGIVDEQELKIERRKYILELYFKKQNDERTSSEAVSNV